jgi:hypothetical protein
MKNFITTAWILLFLFVMAHIFVLFLLDALGLGVYSASNRNEYQELNTFPGE